MNNCSHDNQGLPQGSPEVPVPGSANVAAIDVPAVPQEDLALLDRPRVDDSADEGIINNGALRNKETGDVGPAVGGGGTD